MANRVMNWFGVGILAFALAPLDTRAEPRCAAECVVLQSGLYAHLKITMQLRPYESHTLRLKTFGLAYGNSIAELQSICSERAESFRQQYSTLPRFELAPQAKLA